MLLRYRLFALLGILAVVAALTVTFTAVGGVRAAPVSSSASSAAFSHACGATPVGFAHCHAILNNGASSHAKPGGGCPSPGGGYKPADLRSAYNLTSAGSSAQTVAIVDAFDDPNAESDLSCYRSTFGLPACTTVNGCF